MMTVTSHHCVPTLAGVALLIASTAAAQPAVDAATYEVGYRSNGASGSSGTFAVPVDYTFANGNGRVSVQPQPVTMLSSHARSPGRTDDVGSYAQMSYFFRILGVSGTRVAGTFTANMFASIAFTAQDEETLAFSSFDLSPADGAGRFYDASGTVLASGPSRSLRLFGNAGTLRFNAPVSFIADANAEYRVDLAVQAQAQSEDTADAFLDPVIAIAPAYQSSYSLVLSPGVSNLAPTATTAPEPGPLALVGTGVLGIGAVVRRRHIACLLGSGNE